MQRLLKMFSGKATTSQSIGREVANILNPAAPFYAVGDLHGRRDLLETLFSKLDLSDGQQVVFLGDYIDRGDQSLRKLWTVSFTCRRKDRIK